MRFSFQRTAVDFSETHAQLIIQRAVADPGLDRVDFGGAHAAKTERHARLRSTGPGVAGDFEIEHAVGGVVRFDAQQQRISVRRIGVD